MIHTRKHKTPTFTGEFRVGFPNLEMFGLAGENTQFAASGEQTLFQI